MSEDYAKDMKSVAINPEGSTTLQQLAEFDKAIFEDVQSKGKPYFAQYFINALTHGQEGDGTKRYQSMLLLNSTS